MSQIKGNIWLPCSVMSVHGVRLARGSLHVITAHVDFSAKQLPRRPPSPLKITLLHDLTMAPKIAKLLKQLRSVSAAALGRSHAPILQVRALHAHTLSSCDYVWRGVFSPRLQLAAMQAAGDRHYRSVFGLPKWCARRVLRAPLTAGGPQAPDLYLRQSFYWRVCTLPPPCRSPPQGRRSPTTPWGMVTK